jgi:DNA-binding NtrC family response regulator
VKNILIIDDDREFVQELEDILKNAGHSVDIAFDGINGFDLIKKGKYDLILLDYKMDKINGVELLKKIKVNNLTGKIIIISATVNIETCLEEADVKDLVVTICYKPFNIENFLQKITSI